MIANCPSCGTHYKHEPPKLTTRARCGQCAATVDLTSLRPYRIVTAAKPRPEDAERAARYSPIGLDHPALATEISRNVTPASTMPALSVFVTPPPSSVEPSVEPAERPAIEPVETAPRPRHGVGHPASFGLWIAGGAFAGSLLPGTIGGGTTTGVAVGAALGAVVGWGWLRWTSPK